MIGRLALLAGVALAIPGPARAQDAAAPASGSHGVGFRLLQARDSTRAFRPKRDVSGARVEGETARPVLVALWYPAAPAPDATPMTLEDFRAVRDVEWAFTMGTEQAGLRAGGGEATRDAQNAMRERVVRDAPSLPGPHPVVVIVGPAWVADQRTPAILASHGYVVAAVALIGRMTHATLEYTPNPLTLDTGVDDLGFVYALLQREPIADTDRLALLTFSATSLDALLWQMRDMQADALVFVEGWERVRFGTQLLAQSVHYDPLRVRVPTLLIEGQPPGGPDDPSFALVGDLVDSLAYADVMRVSFPAAQHGDFLSEPSFPGSEQRARVYAETLSIVRRFLDATLREDPGARRDVAVLADGPDGLFRVRRSDGAPPMPTEEELFRIAEVDPQRLIALIRELGERSPGRPLIREHVLSRAAIFAPGPEGKLLLARFAAEMHPRSTNAQWQLARFLSEAGEADAAREALEAARRNVETDPAIEPSQRDGWIARIEQALSGA